VYTSGRTCAQTSIHKRCSLSLGDSLLRFFANRNHSWKSRGGVSGVFAARSAKLITTAHCCIDWNEVGAASNAVHQTHADPSFRLCPCDFGYTGRAAFAATRLRSRAGKRRGKAENEFSYERRPAPKNLPRGNSNIR